MIDNWAPRFVLSRGVINSNVQRALFFSEIVSITNSRYAVIKSRFSPMRSIPASSKISKDAKCAAIPKTGALLNCQPSAPFIGLKPGCIKKRVSLSYPHQPAKRGNSGL